jgi:hypothetical protein
MVPAVRALRLSGQDRPRTLSTSNPPRRLTRVPILPAVTQADGGPGSSSDASADLSTKVRDWLVKHGLVFELTVARAFEEQGFDVDVGVYFEDQEGRETTWREVDVVATLNRDARSPLHGQAISFVIECKQSREKPWVLVNSTTEPSSRSLSGRVYLEGFGATVRELEQRNAVLERSIDATPMARRALRALTDRGDKSDVPFAAVMSATKGAYGLAMQARKEPFRIFYPAVVVDTTMYAATFARDSSQPTVARVEAGGVLVTLHPVGGRRKTYVDVVPASDLVRYVTEAKAMAQALLDAVFHMT